ncbi:MULTISPECIES: hypothetical protein [Vibrio harveyi group]|uniref:hypothetical protein n=1 Tax=Vibrio harveyi group TaxID=717610 RepID=UPI00084A9C04|nr:MULTISPECIES: hypothetical protein [Vibrio harveyi group]EJG1580996.1 hypothetical protein [Vibrio parahaemolyticus]MCE9831056.1 hypothetical protein [Vibrio diabolicus]MCQ9078886.1 hypothetical protein [Vibrio parahaemolyticus]MCS0453219.1 hypothetical protein [Vibrio diabolicus]ODY10140.1 hypothetical protein BBM17_22275 [Vibrio parahaemolyticus]
MHEKSFKLDTFKNSLSENSRFIFDYLVSNKHVDVLTPKMVSRVLKKVYGIAIETDEQQRILLELSGDEVSILYENLTFLGKDIRKVDYLELSTDQKSLVSCHFYATKKLQHLR